MELRPTDFASFFRAVHGCDPFPWQQALVDRLANDDVWPDVLDLPTGTGKTAALDAAVFHLALRSDAPAKAAVRIAFVVDRRLVVDDAYNRAKKIALKLECAFETDLKGDGTIREVARRLQGLAGKNTRPLVARRLRGGAPLEHDWARTPTQPTILCSTVDQVGSRLLFRGYGVSDRMKPVHAGLLGVHSLVLLDEAHLSEPFRQTLDAVQKIGGGKFRVTVLTATPGARAERPLSLTPGDRAHIELKKRLEARKRTALRQPIRGGDQAVAKAFADEARVMADRLCKQGITPAAVGVVVNRVALARSVFEALKGDGTAEAILMIGRSRSVERGTIVEKLTRFRTGAEARAEAEPLFVIATQCLEVGVDLDLDGLVTQAASLDALRQRFGRLNRAGRLDAAEGAILTRAGDVAKKAHDPVYGDRIRLTWEALHEIAQDGVVDFGVEALPNRLKEAGIDVDSLAAERSDAPVVMPAYLDLWSQTSPRPAVDPEVALFLHGSERMAAGVSIVWRSDISETDFEDGGGNKLKELIRLVPPRTAEAIEVPLWSARAWLRGAKDRVAEISDAPEPDAEAHEASPTQGRGRQAFLWAGTDDPRTGVIDLADLRTGDVLIVPSKYGGCDTFGWKPHSENPVRDVADEAAKPYRGRRCTVRIARDTARSDAQWERVLAILAAEGVDGTELVEQLIEGLPAEASEENTNGSSILRDVREPLEALQRAKGQIDVHCPYGRQGGAVLVAERGIKDAPDSNIAVPATEDDVASHTSSSPVRLNDHGCHVADLAEHFARTLGLEDLADDLRLAAYLHDAGKADPRFQTMLSGGDHWNRPDGPPLAKGGRSWSPSAWANAGLPEGWRHEALSVRMARVHPRLAEAHDPALVLWLIGSHHGQGRPFFNFVDPMPERPVPCLEVEDWQILPNQAGPQSLAFDFNGADWPSIFENLKRRYGIWGLAYMEAILRLADHRASEMENTSDETHKS